MEASILRLIGVTGWTLDYIVSLTMPQVVFLLRGAGQILYPRLKPQLDAAFANVSDTPLAGEAESGVDKILRRHAKTEQARLAGERLEPTLQENKRQRAYEIQYAEYLPRRQEEIPAVQPLESISRETAAAIVRYASESLIPSDIWAEDVAPLWLAIRARSQA